MGCNSSSASPSPAKVALYIKVSPHDFATTLKRLEDAVAKAQFKVLHVHDVSGTLRAKFPDWSNNAAQVEFCNAGYASKVLAAEMSAVVALPCRIAVWEEEDTAAANVAPASSASSSGDNSNKEKKKKKIVKVGMVPPSSIFATLPFEDKTGVMTPTAIEVDGKARIMVDQAAAADIEPAQK